MLVNYPHLWRTRLVTFFLAAAAAASMGYWTLKWPASDHTVRFALPQSAQVAIDSAKLAQLLGFSSSNAAAGALVPQANATSRYKLIGVIALGSQRGSALIAVDGQPPKPYRVGDRVDEGLVLQAVKVRSVTLAANMSGDQGMTLELPRLPGTP